MLATEQGLQLDPANQGCLDQHAAVLMETGKRNEAIEIIQKSLAIDPNNAWTHVLQGYALIGKDPGNSGKALRHFREALRLGPHSEFARQGYTEALVTRYLVWITWSELVFFGAAGWCGLVRLAGVPLPDVIWHFVLVALGLHTLLFVGLLIFRPLLYWLVRLTPQGRAALTVSQSRAAVWTTGWLLFVVLGTCVLGLLGRGEHVFDVIFYGLTALPLAMTFGTETSAQRWVMAAYTLVVFGIGVACMAVAHRSGAGLLTGLLAGSYISAALCAPKIAVELTRRA